jgi:hypothetical protein
MLVLIGRNWVDAKDEDGRTRLENPGDYVRLEIEAALKRNIPVTSVLVQGARMPVAEQLPETIRDFAHRSGFELSNTRWGSDVREMIRRLRLGVPPVPAVQRKANRRIARVLIAGLIIAVIVVGLALLLDREDSSFEWVRLSQFADWPNHDRACSKCDNPKMMSIANKPLCNADNLGRIAVCWTARDNGYPEGVPGDCAGSSAWCTYKDATITLLRQLMD